MTDQPPPPSDKKPRRRSAPRKRSATKRPADAAPVAGEMPAAADDTMPTAAVASSPAAVAARLDPKPLVDAGGRGDAPAADAPTTRNEQRDAPRAQTHAKPDRAKRARGADAGASGIENDATTPRAPEVEKTSNVEVAPTPPAAAPAAATGTPFPRQAELRPGELIRVPLSVRWRDLDAFNHVNNSKYLSYLEEARLRWMLAMPGMGMDDNVAPVVAASNLNYRRPIAWPADVVIELFVERIGGSSLTIGHRIVDSKDGGTLYCDGNVVMVWIDRNSGRSAPLPESVRTACS